MSHYPVSGSAQRQLFARAYPRRSHKKARAGGSLGFSKSFTPSGSNMPNTSSPRMQLAEYIGCGLFAVREPARLVADIAQCGVEWVGL